MKNAETQLVGIADALVKLAKQVEKLAADLSEAKPAKKAAAKKQKARVKKKAAAAKKAAPPQTEASAEASKPATVLEQVFEVIKRSRKGASIDKLKEKTGLEARQLSNALYKLTKKSLIEARSRGVYFKKK